MNVYRSGQSWLSALVALCALPWLMGAMTFEMESISADGMEVRNLACTMEDGGLMASLLIVGVLASQKESLDACDPGGGAYLTAWEWSGDDSAVSVLVASDRSKIPCVTKVFSQYDAPLTGTCTAVLLVGDKAGAEAAARDTQIWGQPSSKAAETADVPAPPDPEPPPPLLPAQEEALLAMAAAELTPGEGLGPLSLGMPEAKITALLGPPDERSVFEDGAMVYLNYHGKGMSLKLDQDRLCSLFVYSGKKGGYEDGKFRTFAGQLPTGVSWKSTEQDIVRLLGEPEKSGEMTYAPIPTRWLHYGSRGVGFDFIIKTGELFEMNVSAAK